MNLADPFPPSAISWRAQSVSKKDPQNPKAMALAYIDARDVMARLDDAVGPENWSDSYIETPLGRVICTLSIRANGEWISKSDGAGKTDIEGDKGGLSDALKRAAVKWGIGRYLYDMPCPWVSCELYNDKWSRWTPQGLKELERIALGNAPAAPKITDTEANAASIATLAKAAGVSIQTICESYEVSSLDELNDVQAQKAKNRLKLTIEDIKKKEAANG
jgi:hypothetical protein